MNFLIKKLLSFLVLLAFFLIWITGKKTENTDLKINKEKKGASLKCMFKKYGRPNIVYIREKKDCKYVIGLDAHILSSEGRNLYFDSVGGFCGFYSDYVPENFK